MKPLGIPELRSVVGGLPLTPVPEAPPGSSEQYIRSVSTNTKTLTPDCLFVALKGENHDAHEFVGQLQAPADGGRVVAAIVERDAAHMPALPKGVYFLKVANAKAAMGRLASHIRGQLSGSVIAVGGSNGKTSTKHLIDSALRLKLKGTASPKSFNNDIGVPLTIFSHDPLKDYLVLEMGTNHHGELKVLSDMARPDIAVITSISHEHLEGLRDLNGVRHEEASIVSGLGRDGLLVVNGDDPELMPHLASYRGKRVTFGFGEHNDLFASNVRISEEGVWFNLNKSRREVFVPLLGRHTASNALAAIAVGRRVGLSEDDLIAALAKATGPEMRQQLQDLGGIKVLNDAYNANPASMRAAFETLAALPRREGSRRVAVLGEMRELGEASDELHRELGRDVAKLPLDLVVFVGPQAALAREAGIEKGMAADTTRWFADSTEAAMFVTATLRAGDVMLLKGSRGVKLEVVAAALGGASGGGTPTGNRKVG